MTNIVDRTCSKYDYHSQSRNGNRSSNDEKMHKLLFDLIIYSMICSIGINIVLIDHVLKVIPREESS